jgi:hypothetical protein
MEAITVAIKGSGCDQTHALMDLEHVGAFVEQRLLRGVGLRLLRRETQLLERRFRFAAGRSVGQIVRRRRRLGFGLGLRLRLQGHRDEQTEDEQTED